MPEKLSPQESLLQKVTDNESVRTLRDCIAVAVRHTLSEDSGLPYTKIRRDKKVSKLISKNEKTRIIDLVEISLNVQEAIRARFPHAQNISTQELDSLLLDMPDSSIEHVIDLIYEKVKNIRIKVTSRKKQQKHLSV